MTSDSEIAAALKNSTVIYIYDTSDVTTKHFPIISVFKVNVIMK